VVSSLEFDVVDEREVVECCCCWKFELMKVGENAVVRPKMVVKIMPFIMNGYTEVYLLVSLKVRSSDRYDVLSLVFVLFQ